MQGNGFPPFAYNDNVSTSARDFVARVPAAIHDTSALCDSLSVALRFPSYFGRNWDALDECLSDLNEWIEQSRIVLIHDAVPHLSRRELVIYLSILRDAMLCLGSVQEHHDPAQFSPRDLVVAFPRDAEKRVEEAWSGVKPSDYS